MAKGGRTLARAIIIAMYIAGYLTVIEDNQPNFTREKGIMMNQTKYSAGDGMRAAALMCCDQNGLCLKKKGNIDASHSGTYTAVMRLASQLDGFPSSTTASRTGLTVSLDTDNSATIIKQFDGHTVVMKAPKSIINQSIQGSGKDGAEENLSDPTSNESSGQDDGQGSQ